MDEQLARFLEEDSNLKSLKETFEKHKVYNIRALKMVTDAQFETIGVAIGQVATVRAKLSEESANLNSEVKREERIKKIVGQIRMNESKGKSRSNPAKCKNRQMAKNPSRKYVKLHLGWLHRSHGQSRYKQVRIKDGGGVREFTCADDEDITVDYLKTKASQLFFPQGASKYGDLSEMKLELGNFAQNSISAFKDTMGEECTFQEYLKSHGLYASKSPIYLMSTLTGDIESSTGKDSESIRSPIIVASSSFGEEKGSAIKDVFMGCSRSELTGEFDSLQMASTPIQNISYDQTAAKPQGPLFGVALKEDEVTLCTIENTDAHRLMINYEMHTESSYSAEVILTSVAFSRKDCFDIKCVSEPLLQDIDVEEFDPLEHGFSVVHISKGQKCFLDVYELPSEVPSIPSPGKVSPEASSHVEKAKSDRLIIYPPSEVWGYDSDCLILGAVAPCHKAVGALYVWYRNGLQYKKGNKLSCIAIREPGLYTVEVQYGEELDISEPVYVRAFSDEKKISSSNAMDAEQSGTSNPSKNESLLPVVERGEWAGTEVAVKKISVRNAQAHKACP